MTVPDLRPLDAAFGLDRRARRINDTATNDLPGERPAAPRIARNRENRAKTPHGAALAAREVLVRGGAFGVTAAG